MNRNPSSRAALLLAVATLAAAAVAACSSPGPTDPPGSGTSTALNDAMPFVPTDATYLTVTDWSVIKEASGHKNTTSASSNAERHATYIDIYAKEATASSFASHTITFDLGTTVGSFKPEGLSNQAQLWGFDALDLRWDAAIFEPGGQAGVYLLRLRAGIDLNALSARFDQRGYVTDTIAGLTVRDLQGATYQTSLPDVEPAMSNVAVLSDGKTLAISTSFGELSAYLRLVGSGAPPDIKEVAAQMSNPWVVALLSGGSACGYFTPPAGWNLDAQFSTKIASMIQAAGSLARFNTVAVGYNGARSPTGKITFVYANASDATNDKAGRYTLAQQAFRLADRNTYASTVFTTIGAEVNSRSLDIDVQPVQNAPIRLFAAFAGRDLVAATCGP